MRRRGFVLLLGATLCQPWAARAQEATNFDGTWEGAIHFDKEAFLTEASTPTAGVFFRIVIHGPVVDVFHGDSSKFTISKPGKFHIAPVADNAVIFATETAKPDEAWTESWVFVVTKKNDRTLIAEYVRLVNNNSGSEKPDENVKFATRGEGELKLTGP